jgi:pyrroline-5-carboxylate reductase
MPAKLTIGFLGAGKMATALARGWVKAGLVKPEHLLGSDLAEASRATFEREVGARTTAFNPDVLKFANVVVLAVKPGQVPTILKELRGQVNEKHLLVSLAAGVPLAKLEEGLTSGARVVRVMPNTPALVGASASAYALGRSATAEDGKLVAKLLGAVGLALEVPEPLLDAVTGLSGSGPAYVYLILEALSDGGVAAGLPRDIAARLAAQTVLGAARMALETGLHPGALKDMVTSPGGTTIEGIHELEKAGVRGALINAVRAAADKARKLGQA